MAKAKKVVRTRRRERKNVVAGQAHIQSTFNNTIISITDIDGNVISWGSAGAQGFKGSRKSTPFAAQVTAEATAKKALEHGMRSIEVFVRGPGAARVRARHARPGAQAQDVGLRPAAARQAKGAAHVWATREAVPKLLRAGRAGAGRHRTEPAPSPRASAGQHRLQAWPWCLAQAGTPARLAPALRGQREDGQRAVVPAQARRRGQGQAGERGHRRGPGSVEGAAGAVMAFIQWR